VRRSLSKYLNAEFRLVQARRVDLDAKCVDTDTGSVDYHYLILAAGTENNYFGLEESGRHTQGLKDLRQAEALRNHVLPCFERSEGTEHGPERTALLTLAVGGGGATGAEVAGALSELVRTVVPHDYHCLRAGEVRLILVEAGPELLSHSERRRGASCNANALTCYSGLL
jgi:NADH dehydrogenase